MFFVTLLNQIYWVSGATLGALLGSVLHFNTEGIEFIMTALFVVMFLDQWEKAKDHRPALIGVGCSAACLLVFGGQSFMADMMPKVSAIRRYIDERNLDCELEVDGGVDAVTCKTCIEAGANVLVAGSAVYKAADIPAKIRELRG